MEHFATYRVGQKKRGHRLTTIILSNLNRFTIFFTERFLGKFAVKCVLKIPPHRACVATLPCEILMSAKQAINDKLQGSVAACLRCGGVVNNQIKKRLLLGIVKETFFKSVNIWQSYTQKRDCLVHFLRLLAVLAKRATCMSACNPTTVGREGEGREGNNWYPHFLPLYKVRFTCRIVRSSEIVFVK